MPRKAKCFKQPVINTPQNKRTSLHQTKKYTIWKPFLPMTGRPQGPGGSFEKEYSHIAFPERNTQRRKQKIKI